MAAQSFGATHRSIADKMLRKTLIIGLGGSALLHTAAIAGVSHLSQGDIKDLDITEIERVEVDPDPVPAPIPIIKPTTPIAKPIPIPSTKPIASIAKPIIAPAPKVVKPIIVATPIPKPVAIAIPKEIATPAPVVKITKAPVPVKFPTDPLAGVISPQPTRIVKPSTPAKDLIPKTDRSQPTTKTPNQSAITNNRPAFGNSPLPSTMPAPAANDVLDPTPSNDNSTPGQPGNNSKLARSNQTSPSSNNQTALASSGSNSSNKAPQGLGQAVDSAGSNSPSDEDFGIGSGSGGLPGNNARIANSRSTIAGGGNSSNQIGLGGIRTNSPNIGDGLRTSPGSSDGFSSSGGSGDGLGGNGDDFISGAPGNNTRIARSSGGIGNGGNGTGGKGNGNGTGNGTGTGNQTGLGGGGGTGSGGTGTGKGGGRRTGSQFGTLDGTGNGNSYSDTNGNDELGTGTPGNVATGGINKLSIQCLSNCEIRYPESLEATDTGKDKILVKVTMNANGRITNAQIARSSGNQKLDSVTLAGVKQMQLTAMGKPLTFNIKVSTLVNN